MKTVNWKAKLQNMNQNHYIRKEFYLQTVKMTQKIKTNLKLNKFRKLSSNLTKSCKRDRKMSLQLRMLRKTYCWRKPNPVDKSLFQISKKYTIALTMYLTFLTSWSQTCIKCKRFGTVYKKRPALRQPLRINNRQQSQPPKDDNQDELYFKIEKEHKI